MSLLVEEGLTGRYRFGSVRRGWFRFSMPQQVLQVQVRCVTESDYGMGPDRSPAFTIWRDATQDDLSELYQRETFRH